MTTDFSNVHPGKRRAFIPSRITETETSPRYLMGVTGGARVLICFSAIWALQGLNGWSAWMVIVINVVVTVALLALSFTTQRAVRRLPQEKDTPEEQLLYKKTSKRFGVIVVVEFIAIAGAVVLFRLFNHPECIAPMICLIVGLHFLPLAFLFQVRAYSLVGTALSLLGGGALLCLLFGLTLGDLYTWSVIVGLSTAVILWLTSFSLLMGVRRLIVVLGTTRL